MKVVLNKDVSVQDTTDGYANSLKIGWHQYKLQTTTEKDYLMSEGTYIA